MKALWIFRFAICACVVVSGAWAEGYNWGIQAAWDNPNANMASGSLKPGYAQLAWESGTVLPVKLRNGMVTMVNLPKGEQIEDAVVGNEGFFQITGNQGGRTLYITPAPDNMGSDTNLIVTGKSGNVYTFYLRSEPSNASEITYSQVDVVLDGGARLPMAGATAPTGGAMNSIFKKQTSKSNTIGVDGEDYDWIKTMKIDPSEFRFDLDIFVPNPDDYVIAPERVWRDRVFTYIDFGDKVISMTQRPVVSLLVEGGESPVGFRTDGQDGRLLIVEAVGDMVLRSGQRIVCIKKRAKPFLIADTASVMALAEANVAQSMMSGNSLNNMIYTDNMTAINAGYGNMTASPTYIGNVPNSAVMPTMQSVPMNTGTMMYGTYGTPVIGNGTQGINMMPTERITAGSYLPNSNIPLITSNQGGVAVELRSDSSVKALDEYWAGLVARFSGNDGKGLLNKYKDSVFYAVDEEGVGELGATSSAARLYRLRIGPMPDIDTAQQLCDQLLKFSGASCQVVRIQ